MGQMSREFFKPHKPLESLKTKLYNVSGLTEYINMGVADERELLLFTIMFTSAFSIPMYILLSRVVTNLYTPITISIVMTAFFTVASPRIYGWIVKDIYRRWLEREEPITLLLFALYTRRLSIHRVIQTLNNDHFLRIIPRTLKFFRYILVKTYIDRVSMEESLSKNLNLLPYEGLRRYLFNLIRIKSLGGDVHTYSTTALLELYSGLKRKWISMWTNIVGYLEALILLYGLFPTILSSLVFVIGYRLTISIFIIMMVIYPVIAFITYLVFDRFNVHDPLESNSDVHMASIALILLSIPIGYVLVAVFNYDFYLVSTLLVTLSLIPTFIVQVKRFYDEVVEENGLVTVSIELSSLLQGGLHVVEALKRLPLDGLPDKISSEIRRMRYVLDRGLSIRDFDDDGGGKAFRIFKIAISESIVSGGGSPELASLRELLSSFLEVSRLKRAAFYTALASSVMVVVLGGYSLSVIMSILGSVENELSNLFIEGSIEEIYVYAKAFLAMGASYMGLLLGKLVFGSFKNVLALTPLMAVTTFVYLIII